MCVCVCVCTCVSMRTDDVRAGVFCSCDVLLSVFRRIPHAWANHDRKFKRAQERAHALTRTTTQENTCSHHLHGSEKIDHYARRTMGGTSTTIMVRWPHYSWLTHIPIIFVWRLGLPFFWLCPSN